MWAYHALDSHKRQGHDIRITLDELVEKANSVTECPYCKTVLDFDKLKCVSLDRINNETFFEGQHPDCLF